MKTAFPSCAWRSDFGKDGPSRGSSPCFGSLHRARGWRTSGGRSSASEQGALYVAQATLTLGNEEDRRAFRFP